MAASGTSACARGGPSRWGTPAPPNGSGSAASPALIVFRRRLSRGALYQRLGQGAQRGQQSPHPHGSSSRQLHQPDRTRFAAGTGRPERSRAEIPPEEFSARERSPPSPGRFPRPDGSHVELGSSPDAEPLLNRPVSYGNATGAPQVADLLTVGIALGQPSRAAGRPARRFGDGRHAVHAKGPSLNTSIQRPDQLSFPR
jgi:hypothetical protein